MHMCSSLELLPPMKADGTPALRKPNRFALFVKEHYGAVKTQSPWRTHKQIMERLRDKYRESREKSGAAIILDGSFSD